MIVIFDNPHQNGLYVLCCDVFCIVFIISLSIGMLIFSGHIVGKSCETPPLVQYKWLSGAAGGATCSKLWNNVPNAIR